MGLSYVGTGGRGSATASTTLSISYPTSPTSGNLLIMAAVSNTNMHQVTWPAGWIALNCFRSNNNGLSLQVAVKISDGTETGSASVTWDASIDSYGMMWEYSGNIASIKCIYSGMINDHSASGANLQFGYNATPCPADGATCIDIGISSAHTFTGAESVSGWTIDTGVANMIIGHASPSAAGHTVTSTSTPITSSVHHQFQFWVLTQEPDYTRQLFFDGIDGGDNASATTSTVANLGLNTSLTDDILVALIWVNTNSPSVSAAVSSVSSTSGLTWTKYDQYKITASPYINHTIEIWWAHASSALTGEVVTATFDGSYLASAITVIAVNGCDLSDPWDPGVGSTLPLHQDNDTATSASQAATAVYGTGAGGFGIWCCGSSYYNGGQPGDDANTGESAVGHLAALPSYLDWGVNWGTLPLGSGAFCGGAGTGFGQTSPMRRCISVTGILKPATYPTARIDNLGGDSGANSASATATYDTKDTNCLILLMASFDVNTTVSVSDTNSLTWIRRVFTIDDYTNTAYWYAVSATAQSGTITVTFGAGCNHRVVALSVAGIDTTHPFDTNFAIPRILMDQNGNNPHTADTEYDIANGFLMSFSTCSSGGNVTQYYGPNGGSLLYRQGAFRQLGFGFTNLYGRTAGVVSAGWGTLAQNVIADVLVPSGFGHSKTVPKVNGVSAHTGGTMVFTLAQAVPTVIILVSHVHSGSLTAISDTATNDTAWTELLNFAWGSGSDHLGIWYCVTSDISVRTLTFTAASTGFYSVIGFTGLDTTTIFDPNGTLPATKSQAASSAPAFGAGSTDKVRTLLLWAGGTATSANAVISPMGFDLGRVACSCAPINQGTVVGFKLLSGKASSLTVNGDSNWSGEAGTALIALIQSGFASAIPPFSYGGQVG